MAKKVEQDKVVEREDAIEAILDPQNGNNVILLDGKGEEHEFEQVAIVPLADSTYVILRPINDPRVKEGEAVVFVIQLYEDDLEYYLDVVENEDILDAVFEAYTKMYQEELKKQQAAKAKKEEKADNSEK